MKGIIDDEHKIKEDTEKTLQAMRQLQSMLGRFDKENIPTIKWAIRQIKTERSMLSDAIQKARRYQRTLNDEILELSQYFSAS